MAASGVCPDTVSAGFLVTFRISPPAAAACVALAASFLVCSEVRAQGGTPGARPSCATLVAHGATLAREGDAAAAEQALDDAIALCPGLAAGYRELARLRFEQERWRDSVRLAEQAVALDTNDRAAWMVLATARFAADDSRGALDAWQHVEAARVADVSVSGLENTSPAVVRTALGLEAGTVLTRAALTRAARRLEDFPTGSSTMLTLMPTEDGRVSVGARVDEPSRMPRGLVGWSTAAAVALLTRDLHSDMSSLVAPGALWHTSYRWPSTRRRTEVDLAFPTPHVGRGVVRVATLWDRQTYAESASGIAEAEARERVSVSYSDWVSSTLRVEAGTAVDRLGGIPHLALSAGLTARGPRDLAVAYLRAEHWFPAGSRSAITHGEIVVDWRSSTDPTSAHWQSRAGVSAVSRAAPLALWPGAGAGSSRTSFLRGRALVRDGVLTGDVFGRYLAFATLERRHPLFTMPFARVALAGFADAGKAWKRADGSNESLLHVDVGAGLRIARIGDRAEARLDFGVGLRDGATRVSAGYVATWGRR